MRAIKAQSKKKLSLKLDKILNVYSSRRAPSATSDKSHSKSCSKSRKIPKAKVCLTTRTTKSPLRLAKFTKKSLKLTKNRKEKNQPKQPKQFKTSKASLKLSSQLFFELSKFNSKFNLNKTIQNQKKPARSRNL